MGLNINVINETNIILIAIYITYSILSRLPLPNVLPVPLSRKINTGAKTQALFDERSLIEFM